MENNGLNLTQLLKNDYDTENKLPLKKEELFDKFVVESNNEMNILNNKIKHDKIKYYFKSDDRIPTSFNGFNCPLGLIRKI